MVSGAIDYSRTGAAGTAVAALVTAAIAIVLGAAARWVSRGLIERTRLYLVMVGVALVIAGIDGALTAGQAGRPSSSAFLATISIAILVVAFLLVRRAYRATAPRGANGLS
jgi:hypothetical protein